MSKSYYDVLGLNQNATKSDIKKAYRELCMKYHPDLARSTNTSNTEQFKQITEAHTVLANDKSRRRYDFGLEESRRFGHRPSYHPDSGADFSRNNRFEDGRWGPGGSSSKRTALNMLDGFYKPKNLLLGLTLGLTVVGVVKSFFAVPNDKKEQSGKKSLVEAWKNPESGQWEQPAPWSSVYRKMKPDLRLVPREEVRETRR